MALYPGEGFGHAMAQVLAGDREPGGRMPVSIARTEADYPAYALKPDASGDLNYAEGTRLGYRGMAACWSAQRWKTDPTGRAATWSRFTAAPRNWRLPASPRCI
jgi:hypothetical protein